MLVGTVEMRSDDTATADRPASATRQDRENVKRIMSNSKDDASLYRQFRNNGDSDAFAALFARHRDALLRFLWSLCGNQSIAEDLSQHCWLKLMEGSYRQKRGSSLRSFLFTIGRNRYIDEYVRSHGESRAQEFDEGETALSSASNTLETAANAEASDLIVKAMARLPAEQREVLSMWIEGFSIQEMIATTGATRDTVLSRKKYAMRKMQHAIESTGMRSVNG
ncbi:MAG: sigma-70 family RNA polymerase sigma factor [Pseudomonadota bacterium]